MPTKCQVLLSILSHRNPFISPSYPFYEVGTDEIHIFQVRTLEALELAKLLQAPAADQEQMNHLGPAHSTLPGGVSQAPWKPLLAEHLHSERLAEQN